VERAVLVIGLEQAVETAQARQERADPQDRRSDAAEKIEIGADREGHDGHDADEEDEREAEAAAGAHGNAQIAAHQSKQSAHHGDSPPRWSVSASGQPRFWWVAATTMPPAWRWRATRAPRSSRAPASSALVGSSSSQTGRGATRRRA